MAVTSNFLPQNFICLKCTCGPPLRQLIARPCSQSKKPSRPECDLAAGDSNPDYPNDPFSYLALADAHSHLFADRQHHVPFDPARAEQILRQGLARLSGRETSDA